MLNVIVKIAKYSLHHELILSNTCAITCAVHKNNEPLTSHYRYGTLYFIAIAPLRMNRIIRNR